jgi:hypothetical protein
MAPKKKTRKTLKKSKRAAARKATPKKKPSKPQPKKKPSKKPAAKKRAPRKPIAKKRVAAKKTAKKRNLPKRTGSDNTAFLRGGPRSNSGGQSGDLQGLSHRASVDSESVDELLEEGNAFEAGVVMGVEDAGNADESEVRTHEVSEDDVPEEYLDKE